MPDVFYTADLHLGHGRIVELAYRPFPTVDAMNEALIERWNDRVRPDDRVIVVGDLVMGLRAETLPLVGRLHGRKILIPGNHDYPWPANESYAPKWIDRYREYVEIGPLATIAHLGDGLYVDVCHFPRAGIDHTEDIRYPEHRPPDTGRWLLHGHVHGIYGQVHHDRHVDVGVDAWDFAPVHRDELAALIRRHEQEAA